PRDLVEEAREGGREADAEEKALGRCGEVGRWGGGEARCRGNRANGVATRTDEARDHADGDDEVQQRRRAKSPGKAVRRDEGESADEGADRSAEAVREIEQSNRRARRRRIPAERAGRH